MCVDNSRDGVNRGLVHFLKWITMGIDPSFFLTIPTLKLIESDKAKTAFDVDSLGILNKKGKSKIC